jgi:gamma-glutamylputrescine oxidase
MSDGAPLWHRQPPVRSPPLDGDAAADVVIVGGGIGGLVCARLLAAAGRDVVLLERDACGSGASGRSSGFVTPDSEIALPALIHTVGPELATRLWRFVRSGVEEVRELISAEELTCDAQDQPSLLIATRPSGVAAVKAEHAARLQLGFPSVYHPEEHVRTVLGTDQAYAASGYAGTFGVDPWAMCQGARAALVRRGVRVHESTPVTAVGPGGVTTAHGRVTAPHVIVCGDRRELALGLLPHDLWHVQTFLLATEPLPEDAFHRLFPSGPQLVWDTDLVYHYLRPFGDRRLLIGGGDATNTYADRDDARLPRMTRRLVRWFGRMFPDIPVDVADAWSGRLAVSKDLLPVLDEHDGVIVMGAATGLPWAAALGRSIADRLVLDRPDELWPSFRPGRAYPVSEGVQRFVGRTAAFALSHAYEKKLA